MQMLSFGLYLFLLSPSHGITAPSQIQALEFLFNSTQGENWAWKNQLLNGPSWSFTTPQPDPCNDNNKAWQGVVCSSSPPTCQIKNCDIISLSLDGLQLNGTLPSVFFLKLTSLTNLIITSSLGLTGTIPNSLGSLSNLEKLNFILTQLDGTIPSTALCTFSEFLFGINPFDHRFIIVLDSLISL
jgi:hypothetical protein